MNRNSAPTGTYNTWAHPPVDPKRKLTRQTRSVWRVGFVVIAVMFFGLGGWASVAQLSSAAIAPGAVSPDGSQRTIQHLEGGIVRELRVREGETVAKGQTLIILDRALAQANYQSRHAKLLRLQITRDRLLALQNQSADFEISVDLPRGTDTTFAEFVANERRTFEIKQKLFSEQMAIFVRQESQVENEITGLKHQEDGLRQQVVLLEDEINAKQALFDSGLSRKPELLALQRKRAELASEADAIVSTIARARQKVEEIQLAVLSFESETFERVAEQISQINTEISQAEEAFNATGDVLKRTDIVSPINGRILELNYKTIGGVVRPGDAIMVVVPEDEELIVDARLSPSDIDNVNLGMEANVQFMSFLARHMLPLRGEVTRIGADVVTDQQTGEVYYPLRVRVERRQAENGEPQVELHPGMPAEVYVATGIHTPVQYVFGPLVQSFRRAFREEPV